MLIFLRVIIVSFDLFVCEWYARSAKITPKIQVKIVSLATRVSQSMILSLSLRLKCLQVMKSQRSKSLHEAEDLVAINDHWSISQPPPSYYFWQFFSRLVINIDISFTLIISSVILNKEMIVFATRWESSWGRSRRFLGSIAQFPSTGSSSSLSLSLLSSTLSLLSSTSLSFPISFLLQRHDVVEGVHCERTIIKRWF